MEYRGIGTHLHTQFSASQVHLSQLSLSPRLSNPVGTNLREVSHQMKRLSLLPQPPAYIPPNINNGASEITELNSLLELFCKWLFVEEHPRIVVSLVERPL